MVFKGVFTLFSRYSVLVSNPSLFKRGFVTDLTFPFSSYSYFSCLTNDASSLLYFLTSITFDLSS